MLAPNGRMAFVLPFEITYVKYSYPLWTYLGNNFGAVKIIRIHEDFFPDVDVETVLLLADQYGASTPCVDFEIYDRVDDLLANNISRRNKIKISDIIHRKKPFAFSMLSEKQEKYDRNASEEKNDHTVDRPCANSISDIFAPIKTISTPIRRPAGAIRFLLQVSSRASAAERK